ncbi:unnamed protein product [Rodentolepis nana]|uniref:WAPL domain-containing protein n=1 Tax=Rodentolepis nana TaxID=102285 RepID=A0A158QGH1_RODNA|nr:unnamed protein product [Rodentolepis nana]
MPYRTFPPSNPSNSSRKRVNVTFRSNPSPIVESGKPSSRRSSTVSNPSSTSSGSRTNSAPKSSASAHIIAPKFKRVEYASSLWRLSESADSYVSLHALQNIQLLYLFLCCLLLAQFYDYRLVSLRIALLPTTSSFSLLIPHVGFQQRGTQRKTNTNQRGPRPGSSQSQTKTTPSPPPLSTSENSDLDPYAFVEDEEVTRKEEEKEESAPKLSEFAFTEEEEEDDGIKPWFWTPAREVPKQTQPAPQMAQPQKSISSPNLRSGEFKTNGTTAIQVENDAENVLTDKSKHDTQVQNSLQQALSELDYLTSGMNDANSVDARCHKILTLAQKCLSPAKRDLIHAYKLLSGICTKLQDAPNNYCLGLATSGLFFIISRDRDPEFLTPDSLGLLLRLLHAPNSMTDNSAASATSNSDSKYTVGAASRQSRLNKEAANMRSRVQELLESVAVLQQKRRNRNTSPAKSSNAEPPPPAALTSGMAALFAPRKAPSSVASLFSGGISNSAASALVTRHLRMNRQLTARDLVLEAILNLATRRAAPWFRTGMRTGGGLDGIADATIDAMDYLKDLCIFDSGGRGRSFNSFANVKNPTALDDFSLDNLKKVGHYTRALENMTYKDTDNQTHLVRYRDRILIDRLVQCMRLCASRLPRNPPPSISWMELLKKIAKEEEEAFTDHQTNQQPPTSSTNEGISSDGDAEDKTSKDNSAAASVEFQQDQQILLNCLISIFRLLVNLSQSEYAADRLGGCPDFLESTLDCLFHLPHSLPTSRRLDLIVLVLCLLANICEHCPDNRIRIVHLEIKSPESSTGGDSNVCTSANLNMSLNDVGYEDDDEGERNGSPRFSLSSRVPTVSALDEVVKLFLFREKSSLMHEFERVEGREEKTEEADSTTNMTTTAMTTSGFQRPKPPPSILAAAADEEPETFEEAGLKWRLVGTNKHEKGLALGGADSRSPRTKRLRMRAKRRKRRLALLKRAGGDNDTKRPRLESGEYSSEEEEEDEEEEIEEDEDEMCSDEDDASEGSENEDFDEDDEMCGGADVEFVTETQEEKDKLEERMSSANQHMEDSVVAAYAALVLGCILQSSPRYAERIRSRLPEPGKFRPLAIMLAKLASFLSITRGAEVDGYGSIMRIVRILEAQDQPQQPSTSTNSSPTRSLRSITPPVTRSARSRFEI